MHAPRRSRYEGRRRGRCAHRRTLLRDGRGHRASQRVVTVGRRGADKASFAVDAWGRVVFLGDDGRCRQLSRACLLAQEIRIRRRRRAVLVELVQALRRGGAGVGVWVDEPSLLENRRDEFWGEAQTEGWQCETMDNMPLYESESLPAQKKL